MICREGAIATWGFLLLSLVLSEEIKIGILGALTGPDASDSMSTFAGEALAFWVINREGTLYPNHTFTPVYKDDESDQDLSFLCALELAGIEGRGPDYPAVKVPLIVGPLYSADAITASEVSIQYQLPMLSPSATSPLLSGPNYQFFSRIVASDSAQGQCLASIAKHFEWQRVGYIMDSDPYSTALANAFQSSCDKLNIIVEISQLFDVSAKDVSKQVSLLKASGVLIILVAGHSASAVTVFQEFRRQGMIGAPYVYLLPDGIVMIPELAGLLEGSLQTQPSWKLVSLQYTAFLDNWNDMVDSLRCSEPGIAQRDLFNMCNTPQSLLYPYGYDAVFVAAKALTRYYTLLSQVQAGTCKVDQDDGCTLFINEHYGTETNGEILNLLLRQVVHLGVSGQIQFKSNGDPFFPLYAIWNVQPNDSWVKVGEVTPTESPTASVAIGPSSAWPDGPIWPDGTRTIPKDQLDSRRAMLPTPVRLLLMSVQGIILIFILGLAVVVVWKRREKPILNSSPTFLILLLVGCIFFNIGALLVIMRQFLWGCVADIWLMDLGFTFVMASLALKLYRLHRIFNASIAELVELSERFMVAIFSVIVGVELALLLGMTFGDRRSQGAVSGCSPNKPITVTILCLKLIGVLYTGRLLYQTRNIPPRFNESFGICFSIYATITCSTLWLAFEALIPDSVSGDLLKAIADLSCCVSVTVAVFAPKLRIVLGCQESGGSKKKQESGSRRQPSMSGSRESGSEHSECSVSKADLERLFRHAKKMVVKLETRREGLLEEVSQWTEQCWIVEEELRYMHKLGVHISVSPLPLSSEARAFIEAESSRAYDVRAIERDSNTLRRRDTEIRDAQ